MSDIRERIMLAMLGEPFDLKMLKDACDEIDRLRLTEAEQEAIAVAAEAYAGDHGERFAAILRGLLDRTQTVEN